MRSHKATRLPPHMQAIKKTLTLMKNTLPLSTEVRVVARHKISNKEIEKIMTLKDWYELKKQKDYYYIAYQII